MSQQSPPPAHDDQPNGDPWHAFGYVVSGVAVYGVLGWLVDRWIGTTFVVAIGILVGAAFGIYMTFARFNKATPPADRSQTDNRSSGTPPHRDPQD